MFELNSALKATGIAAAIFMLSGPGYADDIEDSINEALEYYHDGEYKDAVESLNYATQLIQQKKGGELEAFLPEPLDGWSAQPPSSQAAGGAMFGGGVTAERTYSKNASSVTVRIITDSPMMQGMMMMFSNPMFAASDGGKLERVGRQKAIVKFDSDNRQGEINIVVAKRFLVTIEGNDVSAEDLKAYAEAIDYKKLKDMP
ncbi:hypothetical protein DFR30_0653 [Thiogranum longum]|uniref:Uncharacterized protein n=1 Tax=Thiogranum longum TaxID=1537524 RepID=A0A4R1HA95_9GAMM|nr:hypothetical protein [Thiogranum longum]TCK17423.1 hypothetical protein DFR30_0653 [Thiogranum longum]